MPSTQSTIPTSAQPPAWRLLLCTALVVGGLGAGSTVSGAWSPEAAQEARAHLEALTELGPRPSGSAANAAAADYLLEVLSAAGYDVEVQEGLAQSQGRGHQGWVRNVVAWLPASDAEGGRQSPSDRPAVLFAAHYDSVGDGPGAADDAISVAALLVVASELAQQRRSRPALFLFTDAEERGLLGAQLFVTEHRLAPRVGAVFNFDHSGRQPPLYAFETAAPNGALLRSMSRVDRRSRPRAFSFATDIYRILPFGTDFTVFKHLEVPGLNFAYIRDGYVYHTRWDRAEGVRPEALEAIGRVVRRLVDDFVVSGLPLERGGDYAVFFPAGPWLVRLGPLTAVGIATGAVLAAAVLLWILARGRRWEALQGITATLLALPLAAALIAAVLVFLRGITGRTQLAYAQPWSWFTLLVLVGLLALVATHLLVGTVGGKREATAAAAAPRRSPPVRPLSGALALWSIAGAGSVLATPSSIALFSFPLLGLAAVALTAALGSSRWVRLGAVLLALALVAVTWIEPLAALIPFLVTTLALTGPTPAILWPVVGAVVAVFLGSFLWALRPELARPLPAATAWRQPAFLALGSGVVIMVLLVLWSPPYGPGEPQRVWSYHVTTGDGAYWALASVDPLTGTTAGQQPHRQTEELWWLDGRWHVELFDAEPAVQPRVTARGDSGGLELEILPPPGSDLVTLFVNGMEIESTDPPTAQARLEGRRIGLRQVVAAGHPVRFRVSGTATLETELLVVSSTVGLPEEPPFAARLEGPVAVAARALTYLPVPIPDTVMASSPEEGARPESADGEGEAPSGVQ